MMPQHRSSRAVLLLTVLTLVAAAAFWAWKGIAMAAWSTSWMLVVLLALGVWGELRSFWSDSPPLGERLRVWSGRYPVHASLFSLILGALLGHLFWP